MLMVVISLQVRDDLECPGLLAMTERLDFPSRNPGTDFGPIALSASSKLMVGSEAVSLFTFNSWEYFFHVSCIALGTTRGKSWVSPLQLWAPGEGTMSLLLELAIS